MRRGRLLIVIALILIVISIGGVFLALRFVPGPQGGTPGPGAETPIPVTATPEPVLNILVAAQNLDRGVIIPTEALSIFPWPTQIVPPSAITDTALVVGARARYNIQRNEPIFTTMIVRSLQQLSPSGSDAAAQIPPGFLAISIPYDKREGVALGVQDGDHVSVIVTWSIIDLDQDFQSALPDLTTTILPAGTGDSPAGAPDIIPPGGTYPYVTTNKGGPTGRSEADAATGLDFYLIPSEPQRPRLVTQAIIQDAIVLHLGDFGASVFPTLPPATNTPGPNETPGAPPPPTSTAAPPTIITLVVSPQDALVLNYISRLREKYPASVQLTLALRSAGDTTTTDTESVTLQYMFERFNIALPAKLPYGPAGTYETPPAPTPVP